jgi:replication-associated recombination protein RarA
MIVGHGRKIGDLKDLVQKDHLSHGYIFYGPAMVGKRTVAQALAHFLEKGEFREPAEGEILQDAKVIDSVGKNSIGIDEVREIKNFLWQKPNVSARRTLIIDDAELLTTEAQNALLKITEEPPASSLLIIVTSDTESLLPTIVSRLQRVYFGAVPEKEIASWLRGNAVLAKKSLGKPGLASRLANDTNFAESLELAEKFLKTTPATRKDFIKKLIDPDEFSLRKFLDAVIITLAWEKPSKAKAAQWHKTLALYEDVSNFGLNPRLQLENLL